MYCTAHRRLFLAPSNPMIFRLSRLSPFLSIGHTYNSGICAVHLSSGDNPRQAGNMHGPVVVKPLLPLASMELLQSHFLTGCGTVSVDKFSDRAIVPKAQDYGTACATYIKTRDGLPSLLTLISYQRIARLFRMSSDTKHPSGIFSHSPNVTFGFTYLTPVAHLL